VYGYFEEFRVIHDSGEPRDNYIEYDKETVEGSKINVIGKYTKISNYT